MKPKTSGQMSLERLERLKNMPLKGFAGALVAEPESMKRIRDRNESYASVVDPKRIARVIAGVGPYDQNIIKAGLITFWSLEDGEFLGAKSMKDLPTMKVIPVE